MAIQKGGGVEYCGEAGESQVDFSIRCWCEYSVSGFQETRFQLLLIHVSRSSVQFEQSSILEDIKREIATAQNDAHRQRLVNWLAKSVPDPSIEHNAALGKHEETTGSWLLNGDILKEWSTTPNSYLWVYGNGK